MAPRIRTSKQPAEYVAGLWRTHLASQLLWKVEPVFQEVDSTFEHRTTAPTEYRAPSFSWAAVDAEKGNGITYAEITDQDLFIEVEDVKITPKLPTNEYGLILSGQISVRGKLRKAILSHKPKGRFGWTLADREELGHEEHNNVYLDCLARDGERIFGPDAGVCILPAALGERTATKESKYIICLLLQLVKEDTCDGPITMYKRIGLTKLSPWADNSAVQSLRILEAFDSDVTIPNQGYDWETGTHRILII